MDRIDYITVHGADTYADMDIGVEEIRDWHVNGNGWDDVGYHYVIRRDGMLEKGREDTVQGAHVGGHNENNLGICLVGGKPDFNYTWEQMETLKLVVREYLNRWPNAKILGHRDWGETGKTCPGFDVKELLYGEV